MCLFGLDLILHCFNYYNVIVYFKISQKYIILTFIFKGILFILPETYLNVLEKSYEVMTKLMHVKTILFANISK